MEWAYSQTIMEKAKSFVQYLNDIGMSVSIDNNSLREYSVKLKSPEFGGGSIVLDYSSKKKTFSIRAENVKGIVFEGITRKWENYIMGSNMQESGRESFDPNEYRLYTDGTSDGLNNTAYAFIVLRGAEIIHEQASLIEAESDEERNSHQVFSEIKAVEIGLDWCGKYGIKELNLYHDYENLHKWVTGEYKAKIAFTRAYVSFVRNCGINIKWIKVKSHAGDLFNEKVDKLASQAINADKHEDRNIDKFYALCDNYKVEFIEHGYTEAKVVKYPSDTPSCAITFGGKDKIVFYLKNNGDITENLHNISLTHRDKIHGILTDIKNKKVFTQPLPNQETKYIKLKYLLKFFDKYRDCHFDYSLLAKEIVVFMPEEESSIISASNNYSILEKYAIKLTGNCKI